MKEVTQRKDSPVIFVDELKYNPKFYYGVHLKEKGFIAQTHYVDEDEIPMFNVLCAQGITEMNGWGFYDNKPFDTVIEKLFENDAQIFVFEDKGEFYRWLAD